MASRVSALLLLGIICLGFASAEMVMDCCLRTSNKHFPLRLVESYRIQLPGRGCDIQATVFFTKGGKKLCLSSDEQWVQRIVQILDNRNKGNNNQE